MRLLNIHTLQLETFWAEEVPRYAILSHTWGTDEVSFQDFENPHAARQKQGWNKISGFAKQVSTFPGLDYCWVDTCCIDKSSSSELSEAINSMFQWYLNSAVCLVWLQEVDNLNFERSVPLSRVRYDSDENPLDELPAFAKDLSLPVGNGFAFQEQENTLQHESSQSSEEAAVYTLNQSRWFSRGWTLQELLAPELVIFFDAQWQCIGCKGVGNKYLRDDLVKDLARRYALARDITRHLSTITGISPACLVGSSSIQAQSIATRMSWASQRITTRIEDEAYCLLGIFKVNMPLLYGEGRHAFIRLQEEIIKENTDQSIFAWGYLMTPKYNLPGGLLANSPAWFMYCQDVVPIDDTTFAAEVSLHNWTSRHTSMTNRGLQIDLPCIRLSNFPTITYGVLQAGVRSQIFISPYYGYASAVDRCYQIILLPFSEHGPTILRRKRLSSPIAIPNFHFKSVLMRCQPRSIYVEKLEARERTYGNFRIDYGPLWDRGYELCEWIPFVVSDAISDYDMVGVSIINCNLINGRAFLRFSRPEYHSVGLYVTQHTTTGLKTMLFEMLDNERLLNYINLEIKEIENLGKDTIELSGELIQVHTMDNNQYFQIGPVGDIKRKDCDDYLASNEHSLHDIEWRLELLRY